VNEFTDFLDHLLLTEPELSWIMQVNRIRIEQQLGTKNLKAQSTAAVVRSFFRCNLIRRNITPDVEFVHPIRKYTIGPFLMDGLGSHKSLTGAKNTKKRKLLGEDHVTALLTRFDYQVGLSVLRYFKVNVDQLHDITDAYLIGLDRYFLHRTKKKKTTRKQKPVTKKQKIE
jgi:hypothetical protein